MVGRLNLIDWKRLAQNKRAHERARTTNDRDSRSVEGRIGEGNRVIAAKGALQRYKVRPGMRCILLLWSLHLQRTMALTQSIAHSTIA
jgi:hypothetical protein